MFASAASFEIFAWIVCPEAPLMSTFAFVFILSALTDPLLTSVRLPAPEATLTSATPSSATSSLPEGAAKLMVLS